MVPKGDGRGRKPGFHQTPEFKAALSLRTKGKKLSPETCAKIRQGLNRPEVKEKMRIRMLGNTRTLGRKLSLSPEERERRRRWFSDPERLARLRANGRYSNPRTNWHHTSETKAKMSQLAQGRKLSVETRLKMSAVRLGKSYGPKSDEHRANLSVATKKLWKDPAYASRMMKNIRGALRRPTNPEVRVAAVLRDDYLIPNKFEYNGQVDARVVVDGNIPDFVWNDKKLVIEVHGGYYHVWPVVFEKKRALKLQRYANKGYQVLELWDDELGEDFDPDIISAKIHGLINAGYE